MFIRIGIAALICCCTATTTAKANQSETEMERTMTAQAALERQKTLWRPEHSAQAQAWIDAYLKETNGKPVDPARFVSEPSGLSHRDIHSVINDRSLGERFFEVHSDMLDPEKSYYIDPFFGLLRGQRAIRAWLVPIMSGQGAEASFDPVFPAEFIDDGEGGTSIDEWVLTQPVDGEWVKIVRGVSVRRYRDGWVRDAVDFFDTTPIRMGMMFREQQGERVVPLPEWPHVPTTPWVRSELAVELSPAAAAWREKPLPVAKDMQGNATGLSNRDLHDLIFEQPRGDKVYEEFAALLHPTEAVYIDPIFGEVHGRQEIGEWLADIMPKAGNVTFELTEKPVFDGNTSYSEWRQVAILPDGKRVVMTRGCSIRRYKDGWVVYAADYFDTAPFSDPEIQAASVAAGATISEADILKYRKDLSPEMLKATEVQDILGLTLSSPPPQESKPDEGSEEQTDLRDKLIDLAAKEIERTGNPKISIRNISRLAGISHNAPYFHFADKQSLIMAVATKAFWKLYDEMSLAVRDTTTAQERHQQLGVGYVHFATSNPGLFRLIGSAEVTSAAPTSELAKARMATAQLFGNAVISLTQNRRDGDVDPKVAAILGWSMMQGLATLLIERQLIPEMLGMANASEVAQALTRQFTELLAKSNA